LTDGSGVEPTTREEVFQRAIDIAHEVEDKLALLATTIHPLGPLAGEELGDYAEEVLNLLPHVLFRQLRQIHQVKDRLRDAHDSLTEDSLPDP
jgi:hypothetical protein